MKYTATITDPGFPSLVIQRESDLHVHNGSSFVVWNDPDYDIYLIPPATSAGHVYSFDLPTLDQGYYVFQFPRQIGLVPSIDDPSRGERVYVTATQVIAAVTVGGSHYGSVEGADIYFQSKLHSEEWFDYSADQKALALQSATFAIDRLSYCYDKTDPLQLLEFPRDGEIVVPGQIIQAIYEEAFQLLTDGPVSKQISKMEVTSRQFSSIRTTYSRGIVLDTERYRWGIGSQLAWMLLQRYLCRNRTVRLHRVS